MLVPAWLASDVATRRTIRDEDLRKLRGSAAQFGEQSDSSLLQAFFNEFRQLMSYAIGKEVDSITVADLSAYPVWEYNLNNPDVSDTIVFPVERYPVDTLDNRIIGTKIQLTNGLTLWATLASVDLRDAASTKECILVSLFTSSGVVHLLQPYLDPSGTCAQNLAKSLNLSNDEIFPISYDISDVCTGHPESLRNTIDR